MSKQIQYMLTITDNGTEDKNVEIKLVRMPLRRESSEVTARTRKTVDALVPALNQLKQSLAEDFEQLT